MSDAKPYWRWVSHEYSTTTFEHDVPGGVVIRTVNSGIANCESMVFVPTSSGAGSVSTSVSKRTRDDLVRLLGENGADNYLSFPDDQSDEYLRSTITDLIEENHDLREQVRRLTTELCGVPVDPGRIP